MRRQRSRTGVTSPTSLEFDGTLAILSAVTGTRKPPRCRICRKRPAWIYKNCPPGVCKRCYHKDVWPERPAARKQRQASNAAPDRTWIDEPSESELP
jgi:hypothetical protein